MLKFSAPFVCSVLLYTTTALGLELSMIPLHEAQFIQIMDMLKEHNRANKVCLPSLKYIAQQSLDRYINDKEYVDLANSLAASVAANDSIEDLHKVGWRRGFKKENGSHISNLIPKLITYTHFELHLMAGILAKIYIDTISLDFEKKIADEKLDQYIYDTVKGYTLASFRPDLIWNAIKKR